MALWPYVLFPAHLQNLGADPLQIGIFMGAASLSGVLIRPWVGHVVDRNGRKRYLLIGGVIFFSTHLLYFLIPHFGWELFLIRLLHGIGTGILMATFFTLAADLSPPDRRIGGIALFGISGQLSGTISVPLGEKMVSLGGFPFLFMLCVFFSGMSLLLSLFIRESVNQEPPQESLWKRAFIPSLRIPFLATFAFSLGLTSYAVFLKPYALSVGLDRVSSFFLAYTVAAIAVRLIGGHWPDRYGPKLALYPALLSLALGMVLIFLVPTRTGLIVSGSFCGVGHGLAFPILSSIVIHRGGESYRGGFMTLYTLVYDLGMLIGSPFFGLIVKEFNYAALYVSAAIIVTSSVVAFAFFDKPELPSIQPKFPPPLI